MNFTNKSLNKSARPKKITLKKLSGPSMLYLPLSKPYRRSYEKNRISPMKFANKYSKTEKNQNAPNFSANIVRSVRFE